MKVALCFIISYEHILNKEAIWREWIKQNEDIINVYFYYKDLSKIKSKWILEHTIPPRFIHETSYYHVINAYLSILSYAVTHDKQNEWFCMLTDSCCPIISPVKFKYQFMKYSHKTIMSWRRAWWNIEFHKRANLALLPEELRLANDPWFVLNRKHVFSIMEFYEKRENMAKKICDGGLANESLFAIALKVQNQLGKEVICSATHATDWSRMTSSTSPYLFDNAASETDIKFIESNLKREHNKVMFIRKIHPSFPDEVLNYYIYEFDKANDDKLVIKMKVKNKSNSATICVILFCVLAFWIIITTL